MKTRITVEKAPLPLPPGTYRLAEDTANPKPDGRIEQTRTNNWESWKTWPKGMLFIVDIDSQFPNLNRVYVWGGYHKATYGDPRLTVLLEVLEPLEETPSLFLARKGIGSGAGQLALSVLDELRIPLSTIQEALDRIEKRELAAEGVED